MKCKDCLISVQNNFTPCLRIGDKSDILFIGDSPGTTENRTKILFSGKAGLKLMEFIGYYGIGNVSAYTNIIQCQPPRNRPPNDSEISNCRKYLLKDIAEVKPKMIILLGKTAIESFKATEYPVIGRVLNKPFVVGNTIVVCIYHPSYILKNNTDLSYFTSFNLISDIYSKMNRYYFKKCFNK